jgi:hypothetical protein
VHFTFWGRYAEHPEEKRNAYRALTGQHEGIRSLDRPRCKWEDNIKMDIK